MTTAEKQKHETTMRSRTHAASILCLPQPRARGPLAQRSARAEGVARAGEERDADVSAPCTRCWESLSATMSG